MEDKKEYYENLCNKYKELKRKTQLEAHQVESSKKITDQHNNNKDTIEMIKAQKELHDCLNLLTRDQLIELSCDPDFMEKATKILTERKMNN